MISKKILCIFNNQFYLLSRSSNVFLSTKLKQNIYAIRQLRKN